MDEEGVLAMNKTGTLLTLLFAAFCILASPVFVAGDLYTVPGKISTTPFTGGLNLWGLEFRGPVEAHIYAPDGRHTGHTGKYKADRDIDEVQYSRFEDFNGYHTTFFTPLDKEYKVKFKAIGSGSFSYKVSKIVKTEVVHTVFYNWVPIGPKATGWIDLVPVTGPGDLHMNRNEPDSFDYVVKPDHVFAGDELDDEIPPTTKAYVTTVEKAPYTTVTLDAWDNKGGSGVNITAFSFDKEKWFYYKVPLFFKAGCNSTLYYFSTDYGHSEEEMQKIQVPGCP